MVTTHHDQVIGTLGQIIKLKGASAEKAQEVLSLYSELMRSYPEFAQAEATTEKGYFPEFFEDKVSSYPYLAAESLLKGEE